MVADVEVSRQVDLFSEALDHPDQGVALRNASMNLARACRDSLGEAWQVPLQKLEANTITKGGTSNAG